MIRDPYSGTQTRFERTDRSGRWSAIQEPKQEPSWMAWAGGIVLGMVGAIVLYLWAVI